MMNGRRVASETPIGKIRDDASVKAQMKKIDQLQVRALEGVSTDSILSKFDLSR
jgi:hypothetical protein